MTHRMRAGWGELDTIEHKLGCFCCFLGGVSSLDNSSVREKLNLFQVACREDRR